jgi:tetratricopeptide (TPR) repeat protein
VLAYSPDNAEVHRSLGMACAMTDDYKNAEIEFRETVKLDSSNSMGYLGLGKVLELTGRTSESRFYYASALRQVPADEKDALAIAQELLENKELAGAVERFLSGMIDRFPRCAGAYVLSGKFRLGVGDYDGAISAFSSASRLKPDENWIPAKIAEIRAMQNR